MRYHTASFGLLILVATVSPVRADLNATLTGVAQGTLEGYDPGIGNVYVGQLNWQQQGTYNSNIGLSNGSFFSFCIEVNQDVNIGGNYTYNVQTSLTSAPVPGPQMTQAQANAISRMWYVYENGTDGSVTGSAADKAAAFQIAIWKILYTNSNGGTTTPYPTSTTTDTSIVNNDISRFYADAYTSGTMADLVALTCGNAQDQITQWNGGTGGQQTFPQSMPAPPGLILMVSGIVPLLALMRLGLFSGR